MGASVKCTEGHHHLLGGVWLSGGHQRIPAVIIDGVTLHHSKDRNLDRDAGMLGSLGGEKLAHPLGVALPSGRHPGRRKQGGESRWGSKSTTPSVLI